MNAVHMQSCTEFTAAGHPLSGAPRSEQKNYFFGGPALRCGGDTTRNRFGTDCPKDEEEDAEVATCKPAEAAGTPIGGLELRQCGANSGTCCAAKALKAASRQLPHFPNCMSGPHSAPQTQQKTAAAQDELPPCTCIAQPPRMPYPQSHGTSKTSKLRHVKNLQKIYPKLIIFQYLQGTPR